MSTVSEFQNRLSELRRSRERREREWDQEEAEILKEMKRAKELEKAKKIAEEKRNLRAKERKEWKGGKEGGNVSNETIQMGKWEQERLEREAEELLKNPNMRKQPPAVRNASSSAAALRHGCPPLPAQPAVVKHRTARQSKSKQAFRPSIYPCVECESQSPPIVCVRRSEPFVGSSSKGHQRLAPGTACEFCHDTCRRCVPINDPDLVPWQQRTKEDNKGMEPARPGLAKDTASRGTKRSRELAEVGTERATAATKKIRPTTITTTIEKKQDQPASSKVNPADEVKGLKHEMKVLRREFTALKAQVRAGQTSGSISKPAEVIDLTGLDDDEDSEVEVRNHCLRPRTGRIRL
ncbi:hypothetical protein CC1G_08916 [Coprinopsis cinerea okayama7|uniref:Uncharacterized protein n=1 Tax=Coprinopsis cinerea (strain Okayama-7 / 130 / ATCC MYA-4618 / FGSC 9003) TaxID=240176 RepID=A8P8B4_COPC7|nr:hypothetical protein CC1G_08916 [Coprinopsis cinerea okayama7\|eukprot:XP_001839537.2 hypothetical protein CC1G_08916 [Coprinopsis cinerea okayama7\